MLLSEFKDDEQDQPLGILPDAVSSSEGENTNPLNAMLSMPEDWNGANEQTTIGQAPETVIRGPQMSDYPDDAIIRDITSQNEGNFRQLGNPAYANLPLFNDQEQADMIKQAMDMVLGYGGGIKWMGRYLPNAFLFRGMADPMKDVGYLKNFLKQGQTEMPTSLVTDTARGTAYPEGAMLHGEIPENVSFMGPGHDMYTTGDYLIDPWKIGDPRNIKQMILDEANKEYPALKYTYKGTAINPAEMTPEQFFRLQGEKWASQTGFGRWNEVMTRINPEMQLAGVRINPANPNPNLMLLAQDERLPLYAWPYQENAGTLINNLYSNPLGYGWSAKSVPLKSYGYNWGRNDVLWPRNIDMPYLNPNDPAQASLFTGRPFMP